MSSPRPWGCFLHPTFRLSPHVVFPTPVGVFLPHRLRRPARRCLPHARGGVSWIPRFDLRHLVSSPRPWGCFWFQHRRVYWLPVFPTPVGVFPADSTAASLVICLPHARGGVSGSSRSPVAAIGVFPTPVGVFLTKSSGYVSNQGLPHARGGVSIRLQIVRRCYGSSPRPWGCFAIKISPFILDMVFPTPVGVFPQATQPT